MDDASSTQGQEAVFHILEVNIAIPGKGTKKCWYGGVPRKDNGSIRLKKIRDIEEWEIETYKRSLQVAHMMDRGGANVLDDKIDGSVIHQKFKKPALFT